MSEPLMTPILRSGTRSTNFFNGRVLTAEDLKVEQNANHTLLRQVGQALGEGVLRGFQVQIVQAGGARPSLYVYSGMAVNRLGQVIVLPDELEKVEVVLAEPKTSRARAKHVFEVCPPPEKTAVPSGRGLYLLVTYPASGYAESAPKVSLRGGGVADECDSRYQVEGVQFRLVQFPESRLPTLLSEYLGLVERSGTDGLYLLRSLLAHVFLGTPEQEVQRHTLASSLGLNALPPTAGPLDLLRAMPCSPNAFDCLMDCDVPLALLFWTRSSLQIVDMAAVRRRVYHRADTHHPPLPPNDRRLAEGEAAYLQFQTQVQDMLADSRLAGSTRGVVAKEYFRYLPAAGFLPVSETQFRPDIFFEGLQALPQELDMAFLSAYLYSSFLVEPIDLAQPVPIITAQLDGNANLLFFMRAETRAQVAAPPPPSQTETTQPPPPTQEKTGQFLVTVVAENVPRGISRTAWQDTLRERVAVAQEKVNQETVFVRAVNLRTGRTLPGRMVKKGKTLGKISRDLIEELTGESVTFLISNVPPDSYSVQVSVPGFKQAKQSKTMPSGGTVSLRFSLVPDTGKGGRTTKPGYLSEAGWLADGRFEKMRMIEKYVRYPWPPKEADPRLKQVVAPPVEVLEKLRDWADQVQAEYADAPVDPGSISVILSEDYTGDTVAEKPYAYVVFGESGAYAPLVLTPIHETLDRPVSLKKASIPGVDVDAADQISEATGIQDADILANAWTGLLEDSLGLDKTTAAGLINDTRGRVDALQGSLEIFSGVNSATAAALSQAGITNAVELANASPTVLASTLANSGVTAAFAQRLISEARMTVPDSTWSLAGGSLGFKDTEIATLQTQGIETQAQFKNAALTQTSTLAATLNINESLLTSAAEKIDISTAGQEFVTARVGAAPVTNLTGVNAETGAVLASAGVITVRDLATVQDVGVIASTLNVDTAQATELVRRAQVKLRILR